MRRIDVEAPDLTYSVLDVLAVPELAFAMTAFGLLGLACWLTAPAFASAVAGVPLLTAGCTGLALLPADAAALLLLGLAAASLGMEVLAYPGYGLHATGGAVSLTLAGLLLQEQGRGAHPAVVLPVAVTVAGLTYQAAQHSPRHRHPEPLESRPVLIGERAIVLHAEQTRGLAVIGGQLWTIQTRHTTLHEGQTVRVTHITNHGLTVEQAPPATNTGTP